MKKILSILGITALLFTSTGLFSACSPKRPQIKIQLNDGKELVYVLYNDYAEETVEHFLQLVKDGYYDNTALSDFQTGRIMAGSYEWNEGFTDLIQKDVTGIDTVKGEIIGHSIKIENNPLLHSFGTLSFYNDRADTSSGSFDSGRVEFFINTTDSNTTYDRQYAIFGKLLNKDYEAVLREILEDKLTDAEDYEYLDLNTEYGVTLPSTPIYIQTITIL